MKEMRLVGFAALVTAVFLFMAARANAHHSFAMFDEANPIKITGTIAKYGWTNPHMVIWVAVIDTQNKATVWTIESPYGPGNLERYGWDKNTLKAGDKVELWISPLKDRRNGGSLQQLTILSIGKVMYNGSRGPKGGLDAPQAPPTTSGAPASTRGAARQ